MNAVPSKPLNQGQVLILYGACPKVGAESFVAKYGSYLSDSVRVRIKDYIQAHDMALSIAGKKLLSTGLTRFGVDSRKAGEIIYPTGKRPILRHFPEIRFSIAHSGELVVCAIGLELEMGIDIEHKKDLNISILQSLLSQSEWDLLEAAQHPIDLFYQFWVCKEATMKAADLVTIDRFATIDTSTLLPPIFNGNRWTLSPIKVDPNYECWLATDQLPLVEIQLINFD